MNARALIFLIVLMLAASAAQAHDARPIFIQLTESAASPHLDKADANETIVQLQWRVPKLRAAIPVPEVELTETCRPLAGRAEINLRDSRLFEQSFACAGGLGGKRITIRYPGPNPAISSLVRIERASGETYSRLLQPDELEYEIPAKRTTIEVAADYTWFGVTHILKGAEIA